MDFTEIGIFHGRRPISRKMSWPWNFELSWSLPIPLSLHLWSTPAKFHPIGATCRPCGGKKPQNRPLSNFNTELCTAHNGASNKLNWAISSPLHTEIHKIWSNAPLSKGPSETKPLHLLHLCRCSVVLKFVVLPGGGTVEILAKIPYTAWAPGPKYWQAQTP